MLLGQNVNSYGKTLETPVTFAELLKEVEKIEGLKRIRFMTSHPKDLSDELIQTMAESQKICHHLHLPLQSGSSRVLKEMNRRYDKEDVVKDRFSRLLTLVQEKGRENSSRFQGTIQEILVEDENREKGTLTGRTQHNLLVHFPGEKDLIGKYVKVSLDTCKGFYYFGHIVEE